MPVTSEFRSVASTGGLSLAAARDPGGNPSARRWPGAPVSPISAAALRALSRLRREPSSGSATPSRPRGLCVGARRLGVCAEPCPSRPRPDVCVVVPVSRIRRASPETKLPPPVSLFTRRPVLGAAGGVPALLVLAFGAPALREASSCCCASRTLARISSSASSMEPAVSGPPLPRAGWAGCAVWPRVAVLACAGPWARCGCCCACLAAGVAGRPGAAPSPSPAVGGLGAASSSCGGFFRPKAGRMKKTMKKMIPRIVSKLRFTPTLRLARQLGRCCRACWCQT